MTGVDWLDEWGETDLMALMALETHRDTTCSQCGNDVTVCRDSAIDGRVQVHLDTCYVSAAVQRFTRDSEDEPGRLIWTEILPAGQDATDPIAADLEAGYRSLLARHGSFMTARAPHAADEQHDPGEHADQ